MAFITSKPKILNIIYFIDTNKTRTLRISFIWVCCFVILLLGLLIWSAISLILIKNILQQKAYLSKKLKIRLANILQYQIKYEDIYEKAYQPLNISNIQQTQQSITSIKTDSETNTTSISSSSIPSTNTFANNSDSSNISTPSQNKKFSINSQPSIKNNKNDTLALETNKFTVIPIESIKVDNLNIKVDIQDIKYWINDSNLVVSFIIKNNKNNDKANGYLWGIATYSTKDNKEINVFTPKNILYDNDTIMNPEVTFKYSIKYFKHKSIEFEKPNTAGFFKSFKIGILDQDTKLINYYTVSLTNIDNSVPQ